MPVIMSDGSPGNKAVVLAYSSFWTSVMSYSGDDPANPGVNANNENTYSYWAQLNTGVTRMWKSGSGSGVTADALGIAGHNLATTGSRLWLQYSSDQVDWTNAFAPYDAVTDDSLLFLFPSTTAIHWRVSLGNSSGARVAVVYLGRRLEFPHTPVDNYKPTHHAKRYTKVFNSSIKGQFLGNRVMGAGGATSVTFPLVQRNWVDSNLLDFEDRYNRGTPFFYAGYPGGKPQDIAFARAGSSDSIIDVNYVEADKLATVSFDMETYVP